MKTDYKLDVELLH